VILVGHFALHIDCKDYAQIEKLVHDYTRDLLNCRYNNPFSSNFGPLEDFQLVLLGKLVQPVIGNMETR